MGGYSFWGFYLSIGVSICLHIALIQTFGLDSSKNDISAVVRVSTVKKVSTIQKPHGLCSKISIFGHSLDLDQCFPKSGPPTIFGPQKFLFWSARKKPLLLNKNFAEICSKIQNFIYKTVRNPKKIWINGPRKFFINFLVRQIFFQCFLVRKLKKFGKHWSRLLILTVQKACLNMLRKFW